MTLTPSQVRAPQEARVAGVDAPLTALAEEGRIGLGCRETLPGLADDGRFIPVRLQRRAQRYMHRQQGSCFNQRATAAAGPRSERVCRRELQAVSQSLYTLFSPDPVLDIGSRDVH